MVIFCFDHSLSWIYYLNLCTDGLRDTFHFYILSFLRTTTTLILVQKETELGQVHIYQGTCCKNFQTYLQVITYCSACTDHLDFIFIFYAHLDLLLWNPLILFLCVYNQHLQCLPCLSYCKTLPFFQWSMCSYG